MTSLPRFTSEHAHVSGSRSSQQEQVKGCDLCCIATLKHASVGCCVKRANHGKAESAIQNP